MALFNQDTKELTYGENDKILVFTSLSWEDNEKIINLSKDLANNKENELEILLILIHKLISDGEEVMITKEILKKLSMRQISDIMNCYAESLNLSEEDKKKLKMELEQPKVKELT